MKKAASWAIVIFGMLYFLVPLLATLEFSMRINRGTYSLDAYGSILKNQDFHAAFGLSLILALFTIIIGILIIVPTAYWVQLRLPKLRGLVEFITLLPLVVPAIIIVFGYIRMYNTSSFLPLTQTVMGTNILLCFGFVALAMPYLYRSVETSMRTVDIATLTQAAESLGAGWFTILTRVILPNVMTGILSGAFLTFAIVIGEFTFSSLLNRPTLAPYLQTVRNPYEASALTIIAFVLTWGCMGLIQRVGRMPRRAAGEQS